MLDDVRLAPLTEDHAEEAAELAHRVWQAYDAVRGHAVRPDRSAEEVAADRRRYRWRLRRDPDGCRGAWVGERLVGFALALRRGRLWGLSLLVVDPQRQGRGLGGRLVEAVAPSAEGAEVRIVQASEDPRGIARYHRLGLRLHPALLPAGRLDRARLPSVAGAREGRPADHAWMEELGAGLRGAGYGGDLEELAADAAHVVVDRRGARGWAFVAGARVLQLAATDVATAIDVLWAALAVTESTPVSDALGADAKVRPLVAEHDWAMDVCLAAGLELRTAGPLCLDGLGPPRTYVPSGMVF